MKALLRPAIVALVLIGAFGAYAVASIPAHASQEVPNGFPWKPCPKN
jgi:hypothetical protein